MISDLNLSQVLKARADPGTRAHQADLVILVPLVDPECLVQWVPLGLLGTATRTPVWATTSEVRRGHLHSSHDYLLDNNIILVAIKVCQLIGLNCLINLIAMKIICYQFELSCNSLIAMKLCQLSGV